MRRNRSLIPASLIVLALAVCVVAERYRIDADAQQALADPARDADAVGGVLAVGDHQVERQLVAEAGQPLLDDPPAGRTEDVRDEQDPQSNGLAPGDGPSESET